MLINLQMPLHGMLDTLDLESIPAFQTLAAMEMSPSLSTASSLKATAVCTTMLECSAGGRWFQVHLALGLTFI